MISSGQTVVPNQWNHLALKLKKSTNEVSFSLNNSNVSVNNADLSLFSFNSDESLKIGHDSDGIASNFLGEMDNFTIYNKVISDEQIEDNHATFPIFQLETSGDASVLKSDITIGNSVTTNSRNYNNIPNSAFTLDGSSSSHIEVSEKDYNNYSLKQMTFSTWINPSTLTSQNTPLLTKSLMQGEMQIGINNACKLYFNINNKKIDDVSSTYDKITNVVNTNATIRATTLTYYYVMAFPYSKSPKQNILDIMNGTASSNVITNSISTNTVVDLSLTNVVFDNLTHKSFNVVPKVHIYLLVSTHTLSDLLLNKNTLIINKDYIISESIVNFVSNVYEPYVHISTLVVNTGGGSVTFSTSVFSNSIFISNVKYIIFEQSVDLSDINTVKTFIKNNGTLLPLSSSPINALKEFTDIVYSDKAFTALNSQSGTASILEGSIYTLAVMATYSNGVSAFTTKSST